MKALLTLALLVTVATFCRAQDEYVIVGKVLPDGAAELEIDRIVLLDAIESLHPITVPKTIWYKVRFSDGPRRYLVCEVDTFIIAFECRQVGDNIIVHSQGITHIGTPVRCMNPEFRFADDGEIVGCGCGDKLYEGPPRSCNHSISTPQLDIVEAIEKALRQSR